MHGQAHQKKIKQKDGKRIRNKEYAAKMEGDSARSPRAGVVRPVPTGQAETRARMRSSAGGAPPPTGDPTASWSQSRPATSPELPTASPDRASQTRAPPRHTGIAAREFKSRGPPARRRHQTTRTRCLEPQSPVRRAAAVRRQRDSRALQVRVHRRNVQPGRP